MAEQTITKSKTIKIAEVGSNSYGDMTFTDTEGAQYKITVKRKSYFEKVIEAGAVVKLNYAMSSFGKEYIYNAMIASDLKPEGEKTTPTVIASTTLVKEAIRLGAVPIPTKEMSKDDWREKDRITRKSIERQSSLNAAVELAKLLGADKVTSDKVIATAKLFESYLEGQQTKSSLVQEAKKLGATEIES